MLASSCIILVLVQAGPARDGRRHWAFQPVVSRTPAVTLGPGPIDAFICSVHASSKLAPAPRANARTLLRRVFVDLIGLPPSADELAAFEADSTPDALARVVDRLLASPRYGERWARHWLDVARYADSKGYVFQEERRYPFSYTYRDYVIRAFNDDLPYDRFLIEQLAADQLPGATKESLAAMGFLTLGRRFLNNPHDIIDDRIDVVTRGLLGLTVSCARCHDHKYDPIPTRDYYSLYGVFSSSIEPKDLPLLAERTPGPMGEAFQKELDRLKAEKTKFEADNEKELKANNRKFREQLRAIQAKIDRHLATHPGSPPRAMVLQDAPNPGNARVLQRGNPGNPGEIVPRQFLEVVAGPNRKPFAKGSGRLELAQAIASPSNPLTARVFVNRVWAWHFGRGLVAGTSDFGTRSDPPTHPELLDWLAATFIADGWSVKKLQRRIVLSDAYQRSSVHPDPAMVERDPDNRYLTRMHRQRMDFETQRDSMLHVCSQLDPTPGGPAVDLFKTPFTQRRAIYGFVDRQNLPGAFRTFDFASPDTHCPERLETTVPQQALYLMNNPFVLERAEAVSKQIPDGSIDQRVEALYQRVLGRSPAPAEAGLAREFLGPKPDSFAWARLAQVLLVSNEFIFVD